MIDANCLSISAKAAAVLPLAVRLGCGLSTSVTSELVQYEPADGLGGWGIAEAGVLVQCRAVELLRGEPDRLDQVPSVDVEHAVQGSFDDLS